MRPTRQALLILLALLCSLSLVAVGAARPAQASSDCTAFIFCGTVVNDSGWTVVIAGGGSPAPADANGWCWNSPDNAPRYGNDPFPCKHQLNALWSGQSSKTYMKDADSFRIDAGCLIKFRDTATFPDQFSSGRTYVEDRRGKTQDKWLKLGNPDVIDVIYQDCSSTGTKYYAPSWQTSTGYQDSDCLNPFRKADTRCNPDGQLYVGTNYYYCKVMGNPYGNAWGTNFYWLLTDLDTKYPGRDGRAFVPAFNLTGGLNANDNSAYYYDSASGTWKWIPDC